MNFLCRVFVHGQFTDAIDVFNETTIERARVLRNYDPSPLATIEVSNWNALKPRILQSHTHSGVLWKCEQIKTFCTCTDERSYTMQEYLL